MLIHLKLHEFHSLYIHNYLFQNGFDASLKIQLYSSSPSTPLVLGWQFCAFLSLLQLLAPLLASYSQLLTLPPVPTPSTSPHRQQCPKAHPPPGSVSGPPCWWRPPSTCAPVPHSLKDLHHNFFPPVLISRHLRQFMSSQKKNPFLTSHFRDCPIPLLPFVGQFFKRATCTGTLCCGASSHSLLKAPSRLDPTSPTKAPPPRPSRTPSAATHTVNSLFSSYLNPPVFLPWLPGYCTFSISSWFLPTFSTSKNYSVPGLNPWTSSFSKL